MSSMKELGPVNYESGIKTSFTSTNAMSCT